MSNHFAKPSIHVQNVSSCVSNHAQHATGLGRAVKTYGADAVVFCSVGESSTSEGYFYEAVNGASREKLPVVFVVQDNGYGIAVPKSDQTANRFASDNFSGFLNVEDRPLRRQGPLRLAARDARGGRVREVGRRAARSSTPSACASARTRTRTGTSSTARPRSSPRRARRIPCPRLRRTLVEGGAFSEDEIAAIEAANVRLYDDAADRCRKAPDPDPRFHLRLRRARAVGAAGRRARHRAASRRRRSTARARPSSRSSSR